MFFVFYEGIHHIILKNYDMDYALKSIARYKEITNGKC